MQQEKYLFCKYMYEEILKYINDKYGLDESDIENYNYTPEEFKGKNFELINFLESNENGIIFISIDSLFRKYLHNIYSEYNRKEKIKNIKRNNTNVVWYKK